MWFARSLVLEFFDRNKYMPVKTNTSVTTGRRLVLAEMAKNNVKHSARHIDTWGATGIGVGGIVGGGILALTGVAFAATGPSAVLAFGLNGVIAFLTALSFAELSARFPLSGGTYVFAKKVLSLDTAFVVGWIVWFASIAASALYAVGFASFARLGVEGLIQAGLEKSVTIPQPVVVTAAIGAIFMYTIILLYRRGSAGQWINILKILVFIIIIAGGVLYAFKQPADRITHALQPFFPFGGMGLLQAMGFSFIAWQGFDLIAAVAGEIREPARIVPKAMFLSLAIALVIYLPLLLLVAIVGVPSGTSLVALGAQSPAALVALAVKNFLGPFGYWLVVCAGVLSMLSALHANILAASRVANAMAQDRSLPHAFSLLSKRRETPVSALLLTSIIIIFVVLCVTNIETAGAAASLVFLISFALVHWICILLRQRSGPEALPFRTPFFPAVPIAGGLICLGLAIYQGAMVRSAGIITGVWMIIGIGLYMTVFARRARVADALSAAIDPEMIRLRGMSPLVLVPVANPKNASGLVSLANALAPEQTGRVLLLSVINPAREQYGQGDRESLLTAQAAVAEALAASLDSGRHPETLITIAPQPWVEIQRVSKIHQCESLLLGLTAIAENEKQIPFDEFLGTVDSNVVILRAGQSWHPNQVRKVLIPLGGRGAHGRLLARLLGSLFHHQPCEVTFLKVVPSVASRVHCERIQRQLRTAARDLCPEKANIVILKGDNIADILVSQSESHDLLVLGVQRVRRKQKLLGPLILEVAQRTSVPLVIISNRG